MGSREGPAETAARKAQARVDALIGEIRRTRVDMGLSQTRIASHASISRDRVGRIERLRERDVPAGVLVRMADAVGLDLPLRAFPAGDPLRDAGQLRLLRRFEARLGPGWYWKHEVPLPIPGDKRAWDSEGTFRTTRLVIDTEAEGRLGDFQAMLRRIALKRRDGQVARLVLVVADTRHNRDVLRAAAREFAAAFPADPRRAIAQLREGIDPGDDVLLVL
jgi:transcriptional regulator with XRE-family HTH domain